MKFFAIKAKRKCWTNKPAREALGLRDGAIYLVAGNNRARLYVSRAPLAASRVLRAVQNCTGMFGLAVEQRVLTELGIKPGDTVEVLNASLHDAQEAETAEKTAPRATSSNNGKASKVVGTLAQAINALKVGGRVEVTPSQAKSSAYSAAKKLGIKLKKIGPCLMERVS